MFIKHFLFFKLFFQNHPSNLEFSSSDEFFIIVPDLALVKSNLYISSLTNSK